MFYDYFDAVSRAVLTTLTAIHKYGVLYQNSALRISVEAALTVKAKITATAPSMASRDFGSTVTTICDMNLWQKNNRNKIQTINSISSW